MEAIHRGGDVGGDDRNNTTLNLQTITITQMLSSGGRVTTFGLPVTEVFAGIMKVSAGILPHVL